MAGHTLTLQFLQLFYILIVVLVFLMNIIEGLLFSGRNSDGSLSELIIYSLY